MARLLGIHIQNYRALRDVRLGQVEYGKGDPLPAMACFIGPNGSGKSTLLDAFGFVADCLLEGVEAACDKEHRGGFDRIRTQGSTKPIEFELFFEADDSTRPIVYTLKVDLVDGVPRVIKETLRQRRKEAKTGRPYFFLILEKGIGKVWAGNILGSGPDDKKAELVQLADLNRLGITTLGNLSKHPRIVSLRKYIEGWYLSYFVPDAARRLPPAGAQRWLDRTGSNIANVLQYFQRQYPEEFADILVQLAKSVPGLRKVEPEPSKDKRLLLRFDEKGYADPFYQHSMSDGTLKMLAYAVLLADPMPRPFVGIEEPENGLYVKLVESLAAKLSAHAGKRKTQILITTHSPYFVDALRPDEVWLIRKTLQGHSEVRRAADLPTIRELTQEGIPLGSLWYSNHFGEDGAGS